MLFGDSFTTHLHTSLDSCGSFFYCVPLKSDWPFLPLVLSLARLRQHGPSGVDASLGRLTSKRDGPSTGRVFLGGEDPTLDHASLDHEIRPVLNLSCPNTNSQPWLPCTYGSCRPRS